MKPCVVVSYFTPFVRGNEYGLAESLAKFGYEVTIIASKARAPREIKPFVYRDCDVYVQPSIIEPYGIAVLEAMACGKPVIGTKVGGMLDTIKDGVTGFLVEPGNAEEIADRIMSLEDDNKRVEMGMSAREWVVKNFDWMVIGKRYQEVVEELV